MDGQVSKGVLPKVCFYKRQLYEKELPEDGNLMFITGGDYWISDGNYLQGNYEPFH